MVAVDGTIEHEQIEHEWVPIGTLLLRRGLIGPEQLELALADREQSGRRLGELLVSWGWVSSRDVAMALAEQFQLPFHDLASETVPDDAPRLPVWAVAELDAVVVAANDDQLVVGVGDPTNIAAIERLRDSLDRPISLVVVDASRLESAPLPTPQHAVREA
jgi:MSHA biogenesis protein MshE